jgi:serine/threonine-protein kinase
MGYVYLARDNKLEADVVIKAPRRSLLEDPEFARRFRRETRSLINLSHPHVVKVTDTDEHQGVPFVVMQYLGGGNLDSRRPADAGGARQMMPPGELLNWLPSIAEALDYIHARGLIHRDVKPANIFFDDQGHAYLGDFGVVKVLADQLAQGGGTRLTQTGMLLGTPAYMAPEMAVGHAYDGRADQYSLAVSVYELLTGRLPFSGPTAMAVLMAHTTTPPTPLHELAGNLPLQLSQTVLRGMSKEPAHRYPTCAQFATAVIQVIREAGISAAPTAPLSGQPTLAAVSRGTPGRVPCPSCGGLLTLTPEHKGRKVRCPSCGSVSRAADSLSEVSLVSGPDPAEASAMSVTPTLKQPALATPPILTAPASPSTPFPPGAAPPPAGHPFVTATPAFAPSAGLPAAHYTPIGTSGRREGAGTFMASGIALLTVGILHLIAAAFFAVMGVWSAADVYESSVDSTITRSLSSEDLWIGLGGLGGMLAAAIPVVAGINLIRRRAWGMVLTGTIIAALLPPACLFGLPLGAWILTILMDEERKAAFSRSPLAGPAAGLLLAGVWNLIVAAFLMYLGLRLGLAVYSGYRWWALPGMLALPTAVTMMWGAFHLARAEQKRFVQVSAILGMIPCLSPAFILTLPLGVWAILAHSSRRGQEAYGGGTEGQRGIGA